MQVLLELRMLVFQHTYLQVHNLLCGLCGDGPRPVIALFNVLNSTRPSRRALSSLNLLSVCSKNAVNKAKNAIAPALSSADTSGTFS